MNIPTFREIAEACGVCQATVSNILSGNVPCRASPETANRIRRYATEVGWRPYRKPILPPIPEIELAWLAGIADGEAYIGILRDRCEYPSSSNRRITYAASIVITMCHKPTIDRIRQILQLGCGSRINRGQNGHTDISTWQARHQQAYVILKALRPYLFTKAEEADVVLEFCALPRSRTGRGGLTDEMYAERERLFDKCRALKSVNNLPKKP